MNNQTLHFVYILLCNNGNYYTGYTTELARRYQEHLQGSPKCKYTRSFKPVGIAQCWQVENCKTTALKMENYIKRLTKKAKQELILHPEILIQQFQCNIVVNTTKFAKDLKIK